MDRITLEIDLISIAVLIILELKNIGDSEGEILILLLDSSLKRKEGKWYKETLNVDQFCSIVDQKI